MDKINTKIKHLNAYLTKKYEVSLARAIGESDERLDKVYKGGSVSFVILHKVARFFFLKTSVLKNDDIPLPKDDELTVDEQFIKDIKEDLDNTSLKIKNKHALRRNYRLLSHRKRLSLWISCLLICLPIGGFSIGCLTYISLDRVNTLAKYENSSSGKDEDIYKACEEEAKSRDNLTYALIDTGAEIEKITDISHSSNSYIARMSAWFDFDQMEFHKMFFHFDEGNEFNADNFYTDEDLLVDRFTPSSDGSSSVYLEYSDNIPDVIQFNFASLEHPSDPLVKPTSLSTLYKDRERSAFPGEQQSNNFTDNNSEFFIGNGSFSPDSLEVREKGRAYKADDGSYRYFQKIHFDAKIEKTFDSPRYPLDSVQFHIYLQPNKDSDYIRYNLVDKVIIDGKVEGFNGLSSMFSITNGYRLIKESDTRKNLSSRIIYYPTYSENANYKDAVIKTELEIIIRANKSGMSSFIQAFINLFAVAIWMIIAFFNQSYNNENSIGMIGTGLFAAISSVLVGVSMISDANIFSLITMINIFTLATILIMAYESIAAKRAEVKENKVAMAYRFVKLRIIFYVLTICSILMFIALPFTAYIFTI